MRRPGSCPGIIRKILNHNCPQCLTVLRLFLCVASTPIPSFTPSFHPVPRLRAIPLLLSRVWPASSPVKFPLLFAVLLSFFPHFFPFLFPFPYSLFLSPSLFSFAGNSCKHGNIHSAQSLPLFLSGFFFPFPFPFTFSIAKNTRHIRQVLLCFV